MSKFIITVVENSGTNLINLKNENYMRYVKLKVINSFVEFD